MDELFIKDRQYKTLGDNIIKLLHEIEGRIDNDGYNLLEQLDSMYNQREAIIINLYCNNMRNRGTSLNEVHLNYNNPMF